jgi:spore maturation protein CgeB
LSSIDQSKYAAEVGFIGSYAAARCNSIASLIRAGIDVAIRGDGWQQAAKWSLLKPHWRGPSIYGDEYAKAISGMEIALHFLRRENRDEQDSRTFEIPACGSFMLAERSDAHERLFQEGQEAVFFDDDSDLLEKVRYYQNRPAERNRIAQAGRKRCVEDGYDHRARLLELLARVLKP